MYVQLLQPLFVGNMFMTSILTKLEMLTTKLSLILLTFFPKWRLPIFVAAPCFLFTAPPVNMLFLKQLLEEVVTEASRIFIMGRRPF